VLIAADADIKPTTWNKASEKIYGLKAEEVRGRDLRNFIEVHYPHSTREKVVKLSGQKASGVSRPTS
jgi:PAS domain S-box-containing protein